MRFKEIAISVHQTHTASRSGGLQPLGLVVGKDWRATTRQGQLGAPLALSLSHVRGRPHAEVRSHACWPTVSPLVGGSPQCLLLLQLLLGAAVAELTSQSGHHRSGRVDVVDAPAATATAMLLVQAQRRTRRQWRSPRSAWRGHLGLEGDEVGVRLPRPPATAPSQRREQWWRPPARSRRHGHGCPWPGQQPAQSAAAAMEPGGWRRLRRHPVARARWNLLLQSPSLPRRPWPHLCRQVSWWRSVDTFPSFEHAWPRMGDGPYSRLCQ
eukprot:SM000010S04364  [mRNA]  locus=s10:1111154:1112680:- [translate_table: standard]